MKTLIIYNHPAPYKVRQYNELARYLNLTVLFEKNSEKNKTDKFYNINKYNFEAFFFEKGYFNREIPHTKELVRFIKDHHQEFDKIVMDGYLTTTKRHAIKYMIEAKIPYTLLINDNMVRENWLMSLLHQTNTCFNHAENCLVPNQEIANYLIKRGVHPAKIHLYPYSSFYNEEIIENPDAEHIEVIKKRFKLPKGNLFVCPNQFIRKKNNLSLIKCFINRDDNLLLTGKGPLKKKYEKFIKKNNMQNVFILDKLSRKELFNIYQASNAIITLSKNEFWDDTILEGMANGIPVIASQNILNAKSLIVNGYNGYLVDANSLSEINKALDNISIIDKMNCVKTAQKNTINLSAQAIKESLEK